MGRPIDIDILLKDLDAFYAAHDGRVTYDDIRNYISFSLEWRPVYKLPLYESAISRIKNCKQVVIDTAGDCEFARGLQKAIDILKEDI